jgi:hypothetical protein
MTTEQAIRDAQARWQRRRRRLIGYGQWQPFANAEPVREHVIAIRATGMSLKNLSTTTGVTLATLNHLMYGGSGHPPAAQLRTESATALLAYWPHLNDYVDAAVIDATGTRRRLQALAAIGIPAKAIHQHINFVTCPTIGRARFSEQVTARLARAVRDFYNQASGNPAEDQDINPWVAARCRTAATNRGWAPPNTWDDDTIEDPDAIPQWTGHCGTDRGWWTHRLAAIPVCQPCETAHAEWKAERRHLSKAELMVAITNARSAASNRGASIAEDGRELISYGNSLDTAAARIGIKKAYLQQELARHPESAGQVAA